LSGQQIAEIFGIKKLEKGPEFSLHTLIAGSGKLIEAIETTINVF
jgi:hypothetical protein